MASDRDDNYLFPQSVSVGAFPSFRGGLGLRDLFAGTYMIAVRSTGGYTHGLDDEADRAYGMADAMMKAREGNPNDPGN